MHYDDEKTWSIMICFIGHILLIVFFHPINKIKYERMLLLFWKNIKFKKKKMQIEKINRIDFHKILIMNSYEKIFGNNEHREKENNNLHIVHFESVRFFFYRIYIVRC